MDDFSIKNVDNFITRRLTAPGCITLGETLLTVGGYDSGAGYVDDVWMLKNSEWLLSGHLNHVTFKTFIRARINIKFSQLDIIHS